MSDTFKKFLYNFPVFCSVDSIKMFSPDFSIKLRFYLNYLVATRPVLEDTN